MHYLGCLKALYDFRRRWSLVPDESRAKTPITAPELNGKVAQILDVVWVVWVGCEAHHTDDARMRPPGRCFSC